MEARRRRHGAIRRWLGRLAWSANQYLNDPWDRWMIDYTGEDGRAYCMVREGFYSTARACAREVKGRIVGSIVGSNVHEFPAGEGA